MRRVSSEQLTPGFLTDNALLTCLNLKQNHRSVAGEVRTAGACSVGADWLDLVAAAFTPIPLQDTTLRVTTSLCPLPMINLGTLDSDWWVRPWMGQVIAAVKEHGGKNIPGVCTYHVLLQDYSGVHGTASFLHHVH
jgi:hypothetical protein